jgi:hypothetical protein
LRWLKAKLGPAPQLRRVFFVRICQKTMFRGAAKVSFWA